MAIPYRWRALTDQQRSEILEWRKTRNHPWHWPPHRPDFGRSHFHITAACYEHTPIIGAFVGRLDSFSNSLLKTFTDCSTAVSSWCVLPNHYHALIETQNILKVLHSLGRFHGRLAFQWNREDTKHGRKVFHGAVERSMRSERHYWATLNYVHHNPVRHGYVKRWQDWPWSSASEFIAHHGPEETKKIWKEYPIRDYGADWDAPNL
jgi:putative transposase